MQFIITPEKNIVHVSIDTNREPVNAVAGDFVYDPTLLRIESITTGNSMINFWVDQPVDTNGVVHFSGIVPGGITTNHGELFSIIFSAKKDGSATFTVKNPEAYINDGWGTPATITAPSKTMVISQEHFANFSNELSDTIKPEPFTITRTRDENIFDNEWFVVFSATDKDSGIMRYELCESYLKKCKQSNSPARLESQHSFYTVRVRAYDHAGNVQTASLISPLFIIFTCIIIAIIAILTMYVVFRAQINKFFKKLRS